MDPFSAPLAQLSCLLKGGSVQGILAAARPLVGNPLLLTDLTHNVIACTDEPALQDSNWLAILERGAIPLALTNHDSIQTCYEQSVKENRPILDDAEADGLPTLRKALAVKGRLLAYLDSPCYAGAFTEEQMQVFDIAGDMCLLRLERESGFSGMPEDILEYFIAGLLGGRITDENLIEERIRHFGWKIRPPLQVLSLRARKEMHRRDLDAVYARLAAQYPALTITVYHDDIKVIFPGTSRGTVDADARQTLLDKVKGEGMVAGVSRLFQKAADIAEYNRQSEKALQLGLLLHPEKSHFGYDQYAAFHILEICAKEHDLMRFCHSAIYTLAEYDREHETNMLESLEVYLTLHKNVADAASVLYIHRNTMNYRVNKIHDLLKVDLNDTEVIFHLLLSFHILEYYSASVVRDRETQRLRKPRLARGAE